MEVIGGYIYYNREEHIKWCKDNHVPPVSTQDEIHMNKRTLSGIPLLDNNYNSFF